MPGGAVTSSLHHVPVPSTSGTVSSGPSGKNSSTRTRAGRGTRRVAAETHVVVLLADAREVGHDDLGSGLGCRGHGGGVRVDEVELGHDDDGVCREVGSGG